MIRSYCLGGPIFANDPWRGTLYPENARPDEYLGHYSNVLNTVEGNNTFYGIPRAATVDRWRSQVAAGFQFCFKFPRTISHEGLLTSRESAEATVEFLKAIEPLRDRIGVLLLQLPPHFNGARLGELELYLESLPTDWRFAVEPRHADFFDEATFELWFNEILSDRDINRGIFDTRLLHSLKSNSPSIREAQRKKPNFPERWTATSDAPFLRFVGDEGIHGNSERIELVSTVVSKWIAMGKRPFVFLHTPSDDQVPELCRLFHQRMIFHSSIDVVGEMPNWPGDLERKQMSLF